MNSFENFVVPGRKTEWDVFKEIVTFVILNSVLLSMMFVIVVYMSEFLPVELYPLFLACVGIFAVCRVIFKNRIVPEAHVCELIHQCSGFPKLKRSIEITLNENTFIRISDLLEIKAVALEELQCMRAMHQTGLMVANSAEGDSELGALEDKIDAYGSALDKLDKYLDSIR